MSNLVYFDFTKQVEAAKVGLPPGISVVLSIINNAVYLQYSVRVMVKGKKLSLGQFLDRETAIQAVIDAKYGKTSIRSVNAAEANARAELTMITIGKAADAVVAEVAKPRESLSIERIKELLAIKGLYDWQVTAEHAIDVMDGETLYTITVEDQRNYNDAVAAGYLSEDNT